MIFHSDDSTVLPLYFTLAAIVSRQYIAAASEKINSVLAERQATEQVRKIYFHQRQKPVRNRKIC